jgi:hypothetical protein
MGKYTKNHSIHKYWHNMMNSKLYVKGEYDSSTKEQVLATRFENRFGPEYCFFDYVQNLPHGTYYVDGE